MQPTPLFSLFAVFIMIWLGAQQWRRNRLKRAVRDLPTRLQRQVGPEPDYLPPEGEIPEDLADYVALHRKTTRIQRGAWLVALAWLAYVGFLYVQREFA
ncbi:hypothetical protein [Pacificoceanicola onchidii]|uniref:hypothetical protein n=1 Tax=Pacificoceanicola onchidii TaxID=2562685 RepID=UPI0010A333C1|nr:hypothetical protein [Pacificoceanicola onchidii]